MCAETQHQTGSFWKLKEMVVGRRDHEAPLSVISRYTGRGWIRKGSVHRATEAWNL